VRTSLRFAIAIVLALGTLTACRSRGEKVAHLMDDLRSPDPRTVDRAVRELVEMGEAAVPSLILALKDPEVRVRSAAAAALGDWDQGCEPCRPRGAGDSDNGGDWRRWPWRVVPPFLLPRTASGVKAVRERDGNVRL
jgi:hypothetical protein